MGGVGCRDQSAPKRACRTPSMAADCVGGCVAPEGDSVPLSLDQGEALCLIRMQGEINIASAAELKNLLLQALASAKGLGVDLEHATDLHVTALQLLWAAEREARKSSVGFTVAGRIPEEISVAASNAGFEKFPVPVDPKDVTRV